ncbi:DNA-3-methyladenine glycosylase I [Chloroflexi bacterium TSY]|nr:DNA-3-methyladenine glycosylase I [Chloroflexi bacterium TSY]
MPSFQPIYDRAAARKGGEAELLALLPKEIKTGDELAAIPDDRHLAEMTKRIFCAGFVWRVIESKWPNFEEAFQEFDVAKMAALDDEDLDALTRDEGIVRNAQKIWTVRHNAQFMLDIASEHGTFARFIANWPESDIVDLWALLKKRGSRLGGATSQYYLRFMGKDVFMITRDVGTALVNAGVISNNSPTAKKDLAAVQAAFNHWHEETDLSYTALSRIEAYSIEN